MADIVTLGEILIDFTDHGRSASGMRLFEQNPGGAVANVACAAAKLGLRSAFIGKAGDDMHGRFLKSVLDDHGVDTSGLIMDAEHPTTLAFVTLSDSGESEYSFARTHSADTMLRVIELDEKLIRASRVLHVGTLSLTGEPSRSATLEAVRIARGAGCSISCDVNFRPSLWRSERDMIDAAKLLLPMIDLLKVSIEEARLLTGRDDAYDAARSLCDEYDLRVVAVTKGSDGAHVRCSQGAFDEPAFDTLVVDSTGAGDTFWAAFLYKLLTCGKDDATLEEMRGCTVFALAAASLCVQKRGAIPSLPELRDILRIIEV